jgi:hypothetical protein
MHGRRIGRRIVRRRDRRVRPFLPNEWYVAVVGRHPPAWSVDDEPDERPAGQPAKQDRQQDRQHDWLVATLFLTLWVLSWGLLLAMVFGAALDDPVRQPVDPGSVWVPD